MIESASGGLVPAHHLHNGTRRLEAGTMQVKIKSFDVDMEIKNKGIEIDINDNGGGHRGDLVVTKTGLVWCPGKTQRKNGIKVDWDTFIDWIGAQ